MEFIRWPNQYHYQNNECQYHYQNNECEHHYQYQSQKQAEDVINLMRQNFDNEFHQLKAENEKLNEQLYFENIHWQDVVDREFKKNDSLKEQLVIVARDKDIIISSLKEQVDSGRKLKIQENERITNYEASRKQYIMELEKDLLNERNKFLTVSKDCESIKAECILLKADKDTLIKECARKSKCMIESVLIFQKTIEKIKAEVSKEKDILIHKNELLKQTNDHHLVEISKLKYQVDKNQLAIGLQEKELRMVCIQNCSRFDFLCEQNIGKRDVVDKNVCDLACNTRRLTAIKSLEKSIAEEQNLHHNLHNISTRVLIAIQCPSNQLCLPSIYASMYYGEVINLQKPNQNSQQIFHSKQTRYFIFKVHINGSNLQQNFCSMQSYFADNCYKQVSLIIDEVSIVQLMSVPLNIWELTINFSISCGKYYKNMIDNAEQVYPTLFRQIHIQYEVGNSNEKHDKATEVTYLWFEPLNKTVVDYILVLNFATPYWQRYQEPFYKFKIGSRQIYMIPNSRRATITKKEHDFNIIGGPYCVGYNVSLKNVQWDPGGK